MRGSPPLPVLHAVRLLRAPRDAARSGLAWLRWRAARRPYPNTGGVLRLHLGCGGVDAPGFVNIDARPARHVHHVQGIARLPAFADDSVALVYASHCLEHVPHRELHGVLCEWRRVLAPGGVLRLSVPDFDLMLAAYVETGRDMDSIQQPLMGAQDYPFNFHYTCFNHDDLCRRLLSAGFRLPRRWTPGTDAFTSLPDWSGREMVCGGRHFPVSLNVEAEK